MIIDSFIIEGFSNIEHIRLDVGEINALIAPNHPRVYYHIIIDSIKASGKFLLAFILFFR